MSVTLNKWPLQSGWSKKIFKWIFQQRSEKKKNQPHKDHEKNVPDKGTAITKAIQGIFSSSENKTNRKTISMRVMKMY